jgi:hypothetical protein
VSKNGDEVTKLYFDVTDEKYRYFIF